MTSNPETAGVEPVALAEAFLADFEVNLSCWPREKALRVAANRVLGPALARPAARADGEAQAIIDELNACYLYGVSEKSDKLAQRIIAHLSRPAAEQATDRNLSASAAELIARAKPLVLPECMACEDKPAAGNNPCSVCGKKAPDHANCAVGDRAIAMEAAKSVLINTISDYQRATDIIQAYGDQRVAQAMPTSEAIRADERGRILRMIEGERVDAEATGDESDRAYNLALDHIRDHLTGGGE